MATHDRLRRQAQSGIGVQNQNNALSGCKYK